MIDKQGKKQLKAINNQEEQLKKLRVKKKLLVEKIEKEERPSKNVLLKDAIHGGDGLFLNYYENFTEKRKDI